MFTQSQMGDRCGYWVWSSSGNCCLTNSNRTTWNTYATTQTLIAATPLLSGLGTYTVTIQNAGGGLGRVTSTGNTSNASNRGQAVIEAVLRNNRLAMCALCTKGNINMGGQGTIDSYNSSVGPYTVATASQNGSISANGNIVGAGSSMQVRGDATAGGTVSNTSVSGAISNGAPPQSFTSVMPCGPPYSSSSGITGGSYNAGTGVLTASSNITLAPGTYCFSSLTMSANRTLTVNGPVRIYLTANSNLAGGGLINTTQRAANLQIYSSVVSAAQGITMLGVSLTHQAYMTVYAPDARITFNGGGDFYGALVGGSFDDQQSIGPERLHYDEALSGARGAGIAMLTWRQVF